MNDGKIIIDTGISTEGIKKGVKEINKATKDVKLDKIASQMDNIGKAITNTNAKIEVQKTKLASLKKSFESATDVKSKNKMQEQILNTESTIINLEKKLGTLGTRLSSLNSKSSLNGLDGEFRSASMSITKSLDTIEQKAKTTNKSVNSSLSTMGDGIGKVGDKISNIGDKLTNRVTLPIIGIGTAVVKMEMDAESSFAKVSTVMDESSISAEQLKKSVVDASNKSGIAVTDFNEALYETLSAGVESGKAIEFTSNMTKLAKGGFTETTKAVDVVTSVLNAYGLSADEATNISDKLITTQNIGKTTVDQLADSLGRVIPTANAFGVNIDNVATAMSQLTKNGIQSAEATTYYNSMLNELGSSGTVADKALRELNGKGFAELIKGGKQLPEVLKMLQDYAVKNGQSLNDMFGNMEGAKAALTIMKDGGIEYTEILGEMETSTGATQKAFDKIDSTKLEDAKKSFNELKNAGIELGEELIPIASEVIGEIKKMAEVFQELTPSQQEAIVEFALFAATTGPILKGVGGITSGIGGLIGLFSKLSPILGTTTLATEGMATAGATLAPTLGGLTLAAAPYLLAAAAIGGAGYAIYDGLNQDVIPTIDLFGDKIEIVGETVQTQYGAMTDVVETNTQQISEATKQAVQSYLDMDSESKKAIQDLYINNSTITDQIVADTTTKFDNMSNAVIAGYEKQKTDSISQLNEMFTQEQNLTAEEQAAILEKTNQYYSDKETKTQENEAKINEIIKTAKETTGKLTTEQVQEITTLQNEMRNNAINVLSEQETEAAIILQRMKDYDGQITAEQASEHIKALNDSRDESVQAANDEYDKRIATITKMRDETGSITAEQAETMIVSARTQRDETVKAAEETREGAVSKIQQMNTDIEESVNLSSGKIKTYFDKLTEWWNSWNPPNKTFTYDIAGGSTSINSGRQSTYKPYQKYTGSNGGDVGLSFLNEHGWELNRGSEISMFGDDFGLLSGGSKVDSHMTSVNEMRQEVSGQIKNTISSIFKVLTNVLGQVANNTGAIKTYTKETANSIVDSMNSTTGSFGEIQIQLNNAQYAKDNANNMSIENDQAYINAKAEQERINDMTSASKKALGEVEYKRLKDNADDAVEIAKKTAELDIIIAKNAADEKVKIAEQTKDNLVKLAEATTTAIKNQLEEEKAATEKVYNDKLDLLEKQYNKESENIDNITAKKTKAIDKELEALEEKSQIEDRNSIRSDANNNINKLTTMMNNTASAADKRALALQIENAKKDLTEQEKEWNIEDRKAALEEEKALLAERAAAKKENLKEEYEDEKQALEDKLKDVDNYYNKLLETDSLNAATRYTMLTTSNDELVTLLNSYAPNWQNAGQTLSDSLINGLNSNSQSVSDAVSNMISLRGISGSVSGGYATGTSYNTTAGLYNVDELGSESVTSGSVAYVSKGAAIRNRMQTYTDIKTEISRQVSAMKSSINAEQLSMKALILGNMASNSNKVVNNDNGLTLAIENFNNNSSSDVEQIANELNIYRQRQKTY